MSAYGKSLLRTPALLAIAFGIACLLAIAGYGTAFAADQESEADGSLAVGTAAVNVIPKYGDDAENTTGQSNVRMIYRWGWVGGANYTATSEKSIHFDVTGDGWADTIIITGTRTSKTSGYLNKIRVTVNGKLAAAYSNYSCYIDRVLISVVTLKNKQPFIWFDLLRGDGVAVQKLFQYRNGNYSPVLSNKSVGKTMTGNHVVTCLSADGNTVYATFGLSSTVTGVTRLKYAYTMQGGKLKRKSDTAYDLSYVTKDSGGYTKDNLTAAGTFKAYTDIYMDDVAFTVTPGKTVKMISARVKGKKLLYKIKVGNKTGWISCPKIRRSSSRAPYTLFYETYGKVLLKKDIPTYSPAVKFTAKQLQLYNDHALYIARNEIYAHHGYQFSNGELRSRFMYKKWYSTLRTSLNSFEQYNVNLILSIERNRNSLYAV